MKKLTTMLITLILLWHGGVVAEAATITDLDDTVEIEVHGQRSESWDEDTYIAEGANGRYTVTADNIKITVKIDNENLPTDLKLMVVAVPEGSEAYGWISSILSGISDTIKPFDIFFYQDGKQIEILYAMEITMSLPDGYEEAEMYYVSPDGVAEKLPSQRSSDEIMITTTHNSFYVLVNEEGNPIKPEPPTPEKPDQIPTGDDTQVGLWSSLFLLSSMWILSTRKRKNTKEAE